MENGSANTHSRKCNWCGRILPDEAFAVKPGHERARYKVCRECLALGHSCIQAPPKPKKVPMTPEQREQHRREYQKAYRAAHKAKVKEYRLKARRKALNEVTEAMRKEQRKQRAKEYKREWYHRNKKSVDEKAKAKMEKLRMLAQQATLKTCVECGRTLTLDHFTDELGRRSSSNRCTECREAEKERRARMRDKVVQKPKPERTGCKGCIEWNNGKGCFEGFENTETDFALCGCHQYKKRE